MQQQAGAQAPADTDITQALVGTWQGDLRDLLGTFAATLTLNRDGTFTAQHVLVGGYTIVIQGRWTFVPAGAASRAVISFEMTGSEPEEFCSAGIESNPLVFRDRDTIELGDLTTNYPKGEMRRIPKGM
jgi:hypothetical protein